MRYAVCRAAEVGKAVGGIECCRSRGICGWIDEESIKDDGLWEVLLLIGVWDGVVGAASFA